MRVPASPPRCPPTPGLGISFSLRAPSTRDAGDKNQVSDVSSSTRFLTIPPELMPGSPASGALPCGDSGACFFLPQPALSLAMATATAASSSRQPPSPVRM